MATGLATFDAFNWGSLLKDRTALVVARDRTRAFEVSSALDEAGASVTIAPSQPIACDRCREATYQIVVLALDGPEAVSERLSSAVQQPGLLLVILCDDNRHRALSQKFPTARIGDHSMTDRDFVLFVVGSHDE